MARFLPPPPQLLASAAFLGVNAAWAVQIAYATPHLRALGLTDGGAALAWLAGPLTGVLVQPTVGALSDACTSRHGRRRPFVAAGAVGTAAGLLAFAHAPAMAAAVWPPGGGRSTAARAVALAAFWCADASLNAAQGPARALLVDGIGVTGAGALQVSAAVAALSAVGAGGGYAIAAVGGGVRTAYSVVAVVVVLAAGATVVGVREEGASAATSWEGAPASMLGGAARPPSAGARPPGVAATPPLPYPLTVPAPLVGVAGATPPPTPSVWHALFPAFCVQSLTYLAIFTLYIYATDWGGSLTSSPTQTPASAAYVSGMTTAIAGLALASAVSAVTALALPAAVAAAGVRRVWAAALCGFAVALAAAPAVRGRGGLLTLLAAVGVPLGVAATLPWAAVTATAAAERGAPGGGG
ncbi:hypothetical protein BU14_2923s0001, partial [Porphyra umbilicalis]